MPKTPCLTCGTLTSGSYCPRHTPSRFNPRRGSSTVRDRFRRLTLAKTGGACARCGSTLNVHAHHVIGLAEGGTNDAAVNGQPLCEPCHIDVERVRRSTR
jgi:5-methylcytosine-specific restriction endonuclease McrA